MHRKIRYLSKLTAYLILTATLTSCEAENPDVKSIRQEYVKEAEDTKNAVTQAGEDFKTAAGIGAENIGNETKTFFGWVFDEVSGHWQYAKDIALTPTSRIYDVVGREEEYLPGDNEYRLEEPEETAFGYLENSKTAENFRDFTGEVEEAAENLPDSPEELADAAESVVNPVADKVADAAAEEGKKLTGKAVSKAAEAVRDYADGIVRNIEAPPFIVPEYTGNAYIEINGNKPFFTDYELKNISEILLSSLDPLGRCGPAEEMVGPEMLPTEPRGEIGMVKPSGWHQAKYESLKNSENPAGYLYSRCHLLAYCLSGLNAENRNLITGTYTQFNVLGMEPFELETLSYVKKTGNHVLYRVTPLFKGVNLIADGVLMEAQSIEDDGLSFCVFIYNNAGDSGVKIDYLTGKSYEQ